MEVVLAVVPAVAAVVAAVVVPVEVVSVDLVFTLRAHMYTYS